MILNMLTFPFYKPILLEFVLTTGWIFIIVILIIITLFILISDKQDLKKQLDVVNDKLKQKESIIRENELLSDKKAAELKLTYQNWALSELEKFKGMETSAAAKVLLERWKIESEAFIRQDAINRSYSVNLGKITEHLMPFHINFPFNPKDARFIGSPIDMIVFDGYADNKEDLSIYLLEIKTGNSKLTEIQRKVRDAVNKKNVRWLEINPDNKEQPKLF